MADTIGKLNVHVDLDLPRQLAAQYREVADRLDPGEYGDVTPAPPGQLTVPHSEFLRVVAQRDEIRRQRDMAERERDEARAIAERYLDAEGRVIPWVRVTVRNLRPDEAAAMLRDAARTVPPPVGGRTCTGGGIITAPATPATTTNRPVEDIPRPTGEALPLAAEPVRKWQDQNPGQEHKRTARGDSNG